MFRKIVGIALLAQISVFAVPSYADIVSATTVKKAAEKILTNAGFNAETPGVAILVAHGDKILYRGARGSANLELAVPLNANHTFKIGSVTKQFASVALLKLVDDGKINLTDTLSKYLPEYPGGDTITVIQLLNHTSGVKSYTGIKDYFADERIRTDLSTDKLVDVFKDEPVDFLQSLQ